MKKYMLKFSYLLVLLSFFFLLFLSNLNAVKNLGYPFKKEPARSVNSKNLNINISTVKKIKQKSTPVSLPTETSPEIPQITTSIDLLPDSALVHPAIADADNGNVVVAYELKKEDTLLIWSASSNNGVSFPVNGYWSVDLSYPSIDYWGFGSVFYGTAVPSPSLNSGGNAYLIAIPDVSSTTHWLFIPLEWESLGWHDMRMAAIACDTSREFTYLPGNFSFGLISLVHSRNYMSIELIDAPHLLYEKDTTMLCYTLMDWYDINGCLSTTIDIDKISHYSYAVYDPFDEFDSQRQLFIRRDLFTDMENPLYKSSYQYGLNPGEQIQYPSVAAHNGTLVVICEFLEDASPEDRDIICYYNPSGDGAIDNLTISIVSDTYVDECSPKVSHVADDIYLCTFLREDTVLHSISCDAGANWSEPEIVSSVATQEGVKEYRSIDVAEEGKKIAWEYRYRGSADSSIFITLTATGVDAESDQDNDGFLDVCDNCPSEYNPDQTDLNINGIGDVCEDDFTVNPNIGASPVYIDIADFDYDNNYDLIYSELSDSSLLLAYGNGDGTFLTPTLLLQEGASPYSFSAGHINNDTLLDIVGVDNSYINILTNNDDRTYTKLTIPYSGISPVDIVTGYFNDDAYLDLIITPNYIYYGDGTGNFPGNSSLPFYFKYINVGDFNSDGFDDLLIGSNFNKAGLDSIFIFINDGAANFDRSYGYELGEVTYNYVPQTEIADINRDRQVDFVLSVPVSGNDSSLIIVALGDGIGGIGTLNSTKIFGRSESIVLADINRDNNLDIVLSNISLGMFEIFHGDGLGNIDDPIFISMVTSGEPFPLAVFDSDRDANPDLISGETNLNEGHMILAINNLSDAPVIDPEMRVTGYSNVSIEVINPQGYYVSEYYSTIAGADYFTYDVDLNGELDERTYDYNLELGEYIIILKPRPGVDPGTYFSGGIEIDGTKSCRSFQDYSWINTSKRYQPDTDDSVVFYYTVESVSSIYPANGMKTRASPIFNWQMLSDSIFIAPDSFNFQLDYYYDFRTPRADTVVTSAEDFYLPEPLGIDTVFYWRVRAFEGSSWTDFSRTFAIYVTDACCVYYTGNANCSELDEPDISDITRLIDYLYISHAPLCCPDEADADASGGEPDISDITRLIDYLYLSHTPLADCP